MVKAVKKNIIIFGSGYQAKVIFNSIVDNKRYNFIGFVDNQKINTLVTTFKKKKYRIIDNFDNLKNLKKIKKLNGIIAIGSNFIRNKDHKEIVKLKLKINWETILFKGVNIAKDVKIGDGTVIMGNVLINNNSIIGSHCIINSGSIIEHDNSFADFSSTGPGVVTGGDVKIGKFSHVGIGATILNGKKILSNVIIGAGSLVTKNCKSNSVYYGLPAKKITTRNYNKSYL
jgi:sugar O-acyltransferase (sialic acid O-acetyltransferase NeuD family)